MSGVEKVDVLISSTPNEVDAAAAVQYKDGLAAQQLSGRRISAVILNRPSLGVATHGDIAVYDRDRAAHLHTVRDYLAEGVGALVIVGAASPQGTDRSAWIRNMRLVAETVDVAIEDGVPVRFDSFPSVAEAKTYSQVPETDALQYRNAVIEILDEEPQPFGTVEATIDAVMGDLDA